MPALFALRSKSWDCELHRSLMSSYLRPLRKGPFRVRLACHNVSASISKTYVTRRRACRCRILKLRHRTTAAKQMAGFLHDWSYRSFPMVGRAHIPGISLQGPIKCPTAEEYEEHLPKGLTDGILVNKEGYRLDIYCLMPFKEAINAYLSERRLHGDLCNDHHLGRKCDKGSCD